MGFPPGEAGAHAQDDLISIGTIGLIKGVSTFKPDKKVRLATYASRCIENEILMYFRSRFLSGLFVFIPQFFQGFFFDAGYIAPGDPAQRRDLPLCRT